MFVLATLGILVAPLIAQAQQLNLSWIDNSGGQAGFIIQRATGNTGAYTQIAQAPASTQSYSDTTVSFGTTYCYQVAAVNSFGASPFSNVACGNPSGGFTVAVVKGGSGLGTVTSSPAGIDCGTTCSYTYLVGRAVTLTATPSPGSGFTGWSGGGCGGTDTCTIAGTGSVAVTATFSTAGAVAVSSVTPNQGTAGATVPVTIIGAGFAAGATVSVGGMGITASNVTVVSTTQMTATLTIASGAALGPRSVTVTNAGGGSGMLTGGFSVASAPGQPWTFCATEDQTCSFPGTKLVRYGANTSYFYQTATNSIACNNATFGDPLVGVRKHCDYTGAANPPRTLTVASSTPNSGVAIAVSPNDSNGLGDGSTQFTRTYNSNAAVTLTAPATAGGNNFSTWNGCDSSSGVTCNVTMTADKPVTAVYASGQTWTFCANEDQTCSFPGTKLVRYGANTTFVFQIATTSIACNNTTFGDPLVGVVKHCDYTEPTWTPCANEDQTCSFPGTKLVRYGANTSYFYQTATNSTACNNATFGDPLVGVVKHCDYTDASNP